MLDGIQVNEQRNGPLSTVARKPTPIFGGNIKRIIVLQVLLGGKIASHLGQFAVFVRFARQHTDLAEQIRNVLPRQVARTRRAARRDFSRALANDGGGAKGVLRVLNEKVALLRCEELVDAKNGRLGVEFLLPR